MRSLEPNIGAVQVLAPVVLTGANTSAAIDMLNFESAAVIVATGEIAGDGLFTIKLQESDSTGGGTFTDVESEHLTGEFPTSLAANAVVKVGYIGYRRYIRTVAAKTSGTSIAASVTIIKGHPHDAPVA